VNISDRKRCEKRMSLTRREKAFLELLIREVQDALPDVASNRKVKNLLESWVKANDLHPEKVSIVKLKKVGDIAKLDDEILIQKAGENKFIIYEIAEMEEEEVT